MSLSLTIVSWGLSVIKKNINGLNSSSKKSDIEWVLKITALLMGDKFET